MSFLRHNRLWVAFSLIAVMFVGAGIAWTVLAPKPLGPLAGALPGTENPETYRPPVLGPSETDGFGQGEDLKSGYSLITLDAELASLVLESIEGSLVLSTLPDGQKIVAVPEDKVSQIPDEKQAEKNQPVATFDEHDEKDFVEQEVSAWGIDRIDQAGLPLDGTYRWRSGGSGTRVYVIDTGINTSHSSFGGRIAPGFSAIPDGRGVEDCNGHGTHVAGSAAGNSIGVAQETIVVPVRVLNCDGSGFGSDVLAGIDWVINTHPGGPAVINLSLGGSFSEVLNRAVEAAVQRGFIVVAAAGNSGTDACSVSPASAPGVIGVGASTQSDGYASFSNTGACVDAVAPGESILSAWIGGASATAVLSGTSMAAPHMAGMVARFLQASPGIGASGILEALSSQPDSTSIASPSGTTSLLAAWNEVEEVVEEDEQQRAEAGVPPGLRGRETLPPGIARAPGLENNPGLERAAEAQARNAESLLPGRPSSLSIRQASESSVRVTWATPSPAATTIEIKWWPRTSSPEQASSSSVAGDQTSITLSNISAGVMYEVQVLASVESEEGSLIAEPVTGSFLIPPGQASPGNSGGDSPPGNGNSPSTPPGQSSGEDNGPTEDWPSPPGLNRDDPPGRGNGQGNGR